MSYPYTPVLPTAETLNPLFPADSVYYDVGQTAYVLFKTSDARTRPTRVLTSFGALSDWHVGKEVDLSHDQTGRLLGRYRVVGVHHFASGERVGDVPNMKLKHCVAK